MDAMNTDPAIPTPAPVDHDQESKLAALFAAMWQGAMRFTWKSDPGKHVRSGITKSKMRKRNRVRAKMAKESRRKNRAK